MLQLKGNLYTLTTIKFSGTNLEPEYCRKFLDNKVSQSPSFFAKAPVVIDLENYPSEADFDLATIVTVINDCNFIPVGVRTSQAKFKELSHSCGLPVLSSTTIKKK